MATIEKRGNSYRITVSQGYDLDGKQIRAKMTWTPEPGMTKRQIEKELNRQVVMFEERAQHVQVQDGNIRLAEFLELFMEQHVKLHLKEATQWNYSRRIKQINKGLGHIRLKELKHGHIAAFFANLQEPGLREYSPARAKDDYFLQRGVCADLTRKTGFSSAVFTTIRSGGTVERATAMKIADAAELPYATLFVDVDNSAPYAPGTLRSVNTVLKSALAYAVKCGYIEKNPAVGVDLPPIKREELYLDEPEVRRLIELLQLQPTMWRNPVLFALLSGLRRGELLGLRWQDVDMNDGTLHIRQAWLYTTSFGYYLSTPKTRSGQRHVKIARTAVSLLLEQKRWQEEQRALMGDAWEGTDDRVFTYDTGKPISPTCITSWFGRFIRTTDLPQIHLHSLRHTYASLMIADGVPLVVVSRQLGHANIDTTSDIYAHMIASAEAKSAQIFDRFEEQVIPPVQTKQNTKKESAG